MGIARIGILTVSDRASAGIYRDLSGPAIEARMTEALRSPWEPVLHCVPDEREIISAALVALCDREGCCLVWTTGGTGPAPRDVTPEATLAICSQVLPGFGERMRAANWERVPTAILSRAVAGLRDRTLIVNLPGSPKAIRECIDAVLGAVPDCLELLGVPELEWADRPAHRHPTS